MGADCQRDEARGTWPIFVIAHTTVSVPPPLAACVAFRDPHTLSFCSMICDTAKNPKIRAVDVHIYKFTAAQARGLIKIICSAASALVTPDTADTQPPTTPSRYT